MLVYKIHKLLQDKLGRRENKKSFFLLLIKKRKPGRKGKENKYEIPISSDIFKITNRNSKITWGSDIAVLESLKIKSEEYDANILNFLNF